MEHAKYQMTHGLNWVDELLSILYIAEHSSDEGNGIFLHGMSTVHDMRRRHAHRALQDITYHTDSSLVGSAAHDW
jgi:hypothetical protein